MANYESKEISALSHITKGINEGSLLDQLLNNIYESFRDFIPYNRIGLALVEEKGTVVRSRWNRSDASQIKITKGYSAPLEGSSLQEIFKTKKTRIINDLEDYLKTHPASESTARIVAEGIRSNLTCPLIVEGRPVGFLFFSSRGKNMYKNAHVEFFQAIAGQIARIVEKANWVHLDRLKNELLGTAAHDIRNPLAVVAISVGLLLHEDIGPVTKRQKGYLKIMKRNCERILNMLNDLLDLDVIESGYLKLKKKMTDMKSYLKECHAANAPLANAKSIRLVLELPTHLPCVDMDEDRMVQVLNNLISNAIRYSKSQTVITLKASPSKETFQISVRDQGCGIPPEEMHKLFQPFSRINVPAAGNEKGTGLGLSIAKKIVEAHGGRIWANSEKGEGATFTLSLPLK